MTSISPEITTAIIHEAFSKARKNSNFWYFSQTESLLQANTGLRQVIQNTWDKLCAFSPNQVSNYIETLLFLENQFQEKINLPNNIESLEEPISTDILFKYILTQELQAYLWEINAAVNLPHNGTLYLDSI